MGPKSTRDPQEKCTSRCAWVAGGAKPGGPEHVEISDRYGLSLAADWIPELKTRFGLRMLGEP